jgi:putative lipoprotein
MLDRVAEFFIFGFAPLVAVMLAAPDIAQATELVVKGEVVYRERIALPPGALVTVQLADVSLADAPAAIVAEQKIAPTGQVPVPFELKFDSSAIQAKNSYALQARITVDDALMFINDERHPVDPLKADAQTILVKRVSGGDNGGDASIYGQTWSLQFIDGIGAIESKATLRVEEDGKVTGRAPCNRYFASATLKGTEIAIGKPGATMMACEQGLMKQESAFFDALEKAASFKVENGRLVLMAADGHELLRLAASA